MKLYSKCSAKCQKLVETNQKQKRLCLKMPPKLNRLLISSLIREVKESTSLAKEMASTIGETASIFPSWKYPSRAAIEIGEIESLQQHRGTAGELYILLLELAYDRIQFVLRLMVEFVKNAASEDATCKAPAGTVAKAARLVWSELQRLRHVSDLARNCQQRISVLDECRMAVGNRLAMMTESKMALEKTVVAIRQETKQANDVRIARTCCPDPPLGEVRKKKQENESNISIDRRIINEENSFVPSLPPLALADDPLVDMTRQLESNAEKIETLLRQNDRISRVIARISEHRRDKVNRTN